MPDRGRINGAAAAVIGLVALSSCVPTSVYYAQGVSIGARDADLAACTASARQTYPYLPQTRVTPGRLVPATETCTPEGVCTRTEAYWEPGERITFDANEDVREEAVQGCMGARGYTRLGLPYCDRDQAVTRTTTMPPLAGGTCLLSQPGGAPPLVVNPVR